MLPELLHRLEIHKENLPSLTAAVEASFEPVVKRRRTDKAAYRFKDYKLTRASAETPGCGKCSDCVSAGVEFPELATWQLSRMDIDAAGRQIGIYKTFHCSDHEPDLSLFEMLETEAAANRPMRLVITESQLIKISNGLILTHDEFCSEYSSTKAQYWRITADKVRDHLSRKVIVF